MTNQSHCSDLAKYRKYPIAVTRTVNGLFVPMVGYGNDQSFEVGLLPSSDGTLQRYSSFDEAWSAAEIYVDQLFACHALQDAIEQFALDHPEARGFSYLQFNVFQMAELPSPTLLQVS